MFEGFQGILYCNFDQKCSLEHCQSSENFQLIRRLSTIRYLMKITRRNLKQESL